MLGREQGKPTNFHRLCRAAAYISRVVNSKRNSITALTTNRLLNWQEPCQNIAGLLSSRNHQPECVSSAGLDCDLIVPGR